MQPSTPWWREGRFWGEDNTDSVQILPQEKLGWGEKYVCFPIGCYSYTQQFLVRFVSISAGQDHLLALTSAGRTFAHPITKNANAYGQLGFRKFDIPDSSSKQTRLAVELVPKFVAEPYSRASLSSQSFRSSVSDILAEIDDRNIIFCDKLFEIPVLKGLEVSQVAAGGRSSYVRTSSGKLLGWGANEHG